MGSTDGEQGFLSRFAGFAALALLMGCSPAPPVQPAAPPAVKPVAPALPTTPVEPQPMPMDVAVPMPPAPVPPPVAAEKPRTPLFENWPKPDFILVATGRQNGYIEPCGCAGLTNQKGGLARRWTMLRELEEKGWNPLAVDVGNQVRRFGRQQEIKFQRTAAALKKMKYAAIAYGPDDLRLSAPELFTAAAGEEGGPVPFVAANVNVLGDTPGHRVVTVGGKKIGITAVLGEAERKKINNNEIEFQPAEAALAKAAAALEAEKCDFHILLASASLDETLRLAQKFPLFQLVVTSGGAEEPPLAADKVPGTGALVVQVGGKGMFATAVGVYAAGPERFRYQRVPLDDRFADAPEMLKSLKSYQQELEGLGLAELGVKPIAHPKDRAFVGSAKCGECHTQALAIWEKTPHAHALESLVKPGERSEIARHHDPECLSCHVTGWDPQGFFPYESGYLDLKKSALLHGSGCENCHGPGSAHLAAEEGNDDALKAKLRGEMRLPLAGGVAEKKCMECHDLDNSPEFHKPGAFEKYWKRVEHVGKD